MILPPSLLSTAVENCGLLTSSPLPDRWLVEQPKGSAALRHLDTNMYVFPESELVVVRMQAKPVSDAPSYEAEALKLFGEFGGL